MRDDVLALLEDGPAQPTQLYAWLSVHGEDSVRTALRDLKRAGQIKLFGSPPRWALVSYVQRQTPVVKAPTMPAAPPRPTREERPGARIPRHKSREAAAAVDRLLGIHEPSSGTALCHRCLKRFTADRDGQAFCSEKCARLPPAEPVRTRIIDGQEYEIKSIEELCHWPDGLRGGSSLLNTHAINKR